MGLYKTRATGGLNVPLLLEMSRAIRSFAPALVHVRGLLSGGFYGVMASKLARCRRVLVSVHGISPDSARTNAASPIWAPMVCTGLSAVIGS